MQIDPLVLNLAVALGIGLLIGAERERRREEAPGAAPGGIRTFGVVSLIGGLAITIDGPMLLAVATGAVALLSALMAWRLPKEDQGLTSQMAMVATVLLGGLAAKLPGLAAGIAVALASLLAARDLLHVFVRRVLTERESIDALIFAAATLVVLPLLPNEPMGPYLAFNPYKIWLVVILVMGISAAGYIAVRLLGNQFGLPLAGFAAGFISSAATIGAMANRTARNPDLRDSAVAGSVLSTIATLIQLGILLGATDQKALEACLTPLLCAGLMAIFYGGFFTLIALRQHSQDETPLGRPFDLGASLIFASSLAMVLIISAAVSDLYGQGGVVIATLLAGFADTHAAGISVASLSAAGRIPPEATLVPVLAAIAANTVTKIALALAGGRGFALRVVPGLILVAAAAWVPLWV